jgi:hypothetical protein
MALKDKSTNLKLPNYFQDYQEHIYFRASGYGFRLGSNHCGFGAEVASLHIQLIFGLKAAKTKANKIKDWFQDHPEIHEAQQLFFLCGCCLLYDTIKNRPNNLVIKKEDRSVKILSPEYYEGPEYWFLKDIIDFKRSALSYYKQLTKSNANYPDLSSYFSMLDDIAEKFSLEFGYQDKDQLFEILQSVQSGQMGKTKYSIPTKIFLIMMREELSTLKYCQINLEKRKLVSNITAASALLSDLLKLFELKISHNVIRKLPGAVTYHYSLNPFA